ncbi:LysE family translocator [Streptomyces sp. S.PB5]|uniref:LysE family translocator n=1 Tax=Streptomyces sp. S.PB5 TaxID=3020844 RepID=UPI0025B03535|nr:LysE family translocator [Streptomyces sp. S.PB5]MDN3027030.1 LysE family translocator [Streptomyces sp. S.PB5]
MSVLSEIGAFVAVATVLTITPGLDTTLVLRAAASQGTRNAYATVFGISVGVLCWGLAAAVGASAILAASPTAYTVLCVAGAAYLIWLGIGMLRRARTRGRGAGVSEADAGSSSAGELPIRSWSRGFFSNLLNPRFGLFYMAMLPQFIPEGAPHFLMGLLLALIHNAIDLIWFSLLILGVHFLGHWLNKPTVQRGLDCVAGVVVIAFGAKLVIPVLLP